MVIALLSGGYIQSVVKQFNAGSQLRIKLRADPAGIKDIDLTTIV